MVKYVVECTDEGRNESKFDDLLNGTIFSIACGSAAVDIRKNVSLPYYSIVKGKFRISKSLKVITQQEQLLAFLDFYIPQYSDQAPDKNRVYEIKESWEDVFQKYVDSCNKNKINHLDYPNFCRIRKKDRPNYVKHASQSHAGFDHLKCDICEVSTRHINILRKKRDHEMDDEKMRILDVELRKYESLLAGHRTRANASRANYHLRRVKAVYHRNRGDISFIVDASGAHVTCYTPRFSTTEKGEPARHTVLKIKSTYVKVHGVGSFIVQSLPDIECQGANLTCECVLRGVEFALKQTGRKSLRTVYVQLDNPGSNKNSTLVAICAILVLLGICRKIKINYLEVGHTHGDIDALIGIIN